MCASAAVSIYSSSHDLSEPNFVDYINLSGYNLRKEADRLSTFESNEWMNTHVKGDDLARLGFYFYKRPDLVKCQFCHITIGDFEAGDTALREHFKWSPNCPLIRRRSNDNVPIDSFLLNRNLPPASFDVCGYTSARRKSKVEERIKHPEFKLINQRLKSFETWPVGIKQKPQELAEAGFFYNGQSDTTICFSCDLHLSRWEPTDNVWIEHKKHASDNCDFLKLNHESVKFNEQKYGELKELQTDEVQNESPKSEVQFESLCKICLERKSSVLFLPCKHVAVCGQCVFGIEKDCPICRTPIAERINLYYA